MTTTTRIAFFDTKPYDQRFFEKANESRNFEISFLHPRLDEQSVVLADGHTTVCAFVNDTLNEQVIDALHRYGVKLVALRCAGYNNVDLKKVFGKIHVVRVPAYSPYAVAEHTLALMLSLNRKTHRAYYRTRDGNFSIEGLLGFDMHGKTVGVIGTGKIGMTLIGMLRGLGMHILAYDPYPDDKRAHANGFEYCDLGKLYALSDIVTLHCPLTPENVHMLDAKAFASMKPGVMVINTGRGKLIDTRALIAALKDETVGSAGLDVYEEETDYFFEDYSSELISDDVLARLLSFPNVLVTSHQAFFTREALDTIAATTLTNIASYWNGSALENEICYQCCEGGCAKKEVGRCF